MGCQCVLIHVSDVPRHRHVELSNNLKSKSLLSGFIFLSGWCFSHSWTACGFWLCYMLGHLTTDGCSSAETYSKVNNIQVSILISADNSLKKNSSVSTQSTRMLVFPDWYCGLLLLGLPVSSIWPLQLIQNATVCLQMTSRDFLPLVPLLKVFKWALCLCAFLTIWSSQQFLDCLDILNPWSSEQVSRCICWNLNISISHSGSGHLPNATYVNVKCNFWNKVWFVWHLLLLWYVLSSI